MYINLFDSSLFIWHKSFSFIQAKDLYMKIKYNAKISEHGHDVLRRTGAGRGLTWQGI